VGISICVGSYGLHPFYIESLDIQVYCVEELCVCLQENAFALDGELMSDQLIGWIAGECELPELAKQLYPLVHKKGSLSEFVACILRYVGLLDTDVIQQTDSILKKSAGRSMVERKKLKADHFLYKGKDMSALILYDEILRAWEQEASPQTGGTKPLYGSGLRRGIMHNKGVVLSRMMRYSEACDCFWEAYSIEPSKDSLVAYLGAMRLYLEEGDYIAFLAEHPEFFQASLLLEKRMEETRQSWLSEKTSRVWGQWGEGVASSWDGMLRDLKERYRRSMS
jgi:tetratricopeptide (TPR) repeat protein